MTSALFAAPQPVEVGTERDPAAAVAAVASRLVSTRAVTVPPGRLVGSLRGARLRVHPPVGRRFPAVLDAEVFAVPGGGALVRGKIRLHGAVRPMLALMGVLELVLLGLAVSEITGRPGTAGGVVVLPVVFAVLTVPLVLAGRRLPVADVAELHNWLAGVLACDPAPDPDPNEPDPGPGSASPGLPGLGGPVTAAGPQP